jgi:hypothetical protein
VSPYIVLLELPCQQMAQARPTTVDGLRLIDGWSDNKIKVGGWWLREEHAQAESARRSVSVSLVESPPRVSLRYHKPSLFFL